MLLDNLDSEKGKTILVLLSAMFTGDANAVFACDNAIYIPVPPQF